MPPVPLRIGNGSIQCNFESDFETDQTRKVRAEYETTEIDTTEAAKCGIFSGRATDSAALASVVFYLCGLFLFDHSWFWTKAS